MGEVKTKTFEAVIKEIDDNALKQLITILEVEEEVAVRIMDCHKKRYDCSYIKKTKLLTLVKN